MNRVVSHSLSHVKGACLRPHLAHPLCSCTAGGRLHQEPAPELTQLRLAAHSWTTTQPFTVQPERAFPVPGVHGASLEVVLTLQPSSDATTAASVLLHSELEARAFGAEDTGPPNCCSVAISVDWAAGTLKVGDHSQTCNGSSVFQVRRTGAVSRPQ